MRNVKISVIIPVYNAEKYLRETLQSIKKQSFTDFELIAINDGSTDNSLTILNEFKGIINNYKIVTIDNSGVSKARNIGINISNGEYVCFVDADDILNQHYLEFLIQPIFSKNADLSYCNYTTFYNKCIFNSNSNDCNFNHIKKDSSIQVFDYVMSQGLGTSPWNKLYRLEYLKKYNIMFNENSSYGEDMFFNWKIFLVSNTIYNVDLPLYGYRQNIKGATMKYHDKLFEHYMYELNDVIVFARDNNILNDELYESVNINMLKRFNSIFRMNCRRKDGIKNGHNYIKKILKDERVNTALKLYDGINENVFNNTDKKIIKLMKNKEIEKILMYSYYLDYKFRIFRIIKSFLLLFISE